MEKKFDAGIDVDPDQEIVAKICSYFSCDESWLRGIEIGKQKNPTPEDGDGMSDEERKLIDLFRQVPIDKQESVIGYVESALKLQGLL